MEIDIPFLVTFIHNLNHLHLSRMKFSNLLIYILQVEVQSIVYRDFHSNIMNLHYIEEQMQYWPKSLKLL